MACNMIETNGVFWAVGHLAEFATTKSGRRPRNYPHTQLGWYASTYGDKILVEGCTTAEEATEKARAILGTK